MVDSACAISSMNASTSLPCINALVWRWSLIPVIVVWRDDCSEYCIFLCLRYLVFHWQHNMILYCEWTCGVEHDIQSFVIMEENLNGKLPTFNEIDKTKGRGCLTD